jgi:hypothetical protein
MTGCRGSWMSRKMRTACRNPDIVWRDTGGDIAIWEMNGAAVVATRV